jgi:two-component sensor histidine kinase
VRSRSARAAQLRQDLGGGSFLDPRALVALIPTATLASVVDHAGPSAASVLGWTLANLVAFVVCGVLAWGLIVMTRRRRLREPLPAVATVLAGAVLGAMKALGTARAAEALGLVSMSPSTSSGRAIQGAVLGMGVVPMLVLLRATLERHKAEHRLLVAETFADLMHGPIDDERGSDARRETAAVLGELRTLLAVAAPATAAALLTDAVEHRLRPLTHRLWTSASPPSSDLSLRGLVAAMLRRPLYPVLVPTSAHTVIVTLFALDRTSPPDALLVGGSAAVAMAAVLHLARRSRPRSGRHASGLSHIGLVVVAATASAVIVCDTLLGASIELQTPAFVLLMLAWTVPLVMTSGIVATASHDRAAVRAHLTALLGPESFARLSHAHADGAAARDIADRLHGDLQGSLLAAAARLGSIDPDDPAAREELARVDALLQGATAPRGPSPDVPLATQLEELATRWSGFLEVSAHVEDAEGRTAAEVTVDRRLHPLIVGIVSESLTNAYRHGMAKVVEVRIRVADTTVVLTVDDDGVGPRGAQRGTHQEAREGIGSRHLDTVAPGAWTRTARDVGGTRLEVALGAPSADVASAPHLPLTR